MATRARSFALLSACVVWTAAWAGGPAAAQSADKSAPTVTGQQVAPIPSSLAIAIEPRDDTDANLRLRDQMMRQLAAQRRLVAADGPLLLRFSTEAQWNVGPRAGESSGDAIVASDRAPDPATTLGYSDVDRLMGGQSGAPTGTLSNRYQLRATLERRDGGQLLWEGTATGSLGEGSEQRLSAELATMLIESLLRSLTAPPVPAPTPPRGSLPAAWRVLAARG
jgi:hypothetical protein